jgi:hypothetical protein
MDCSHLSSDVYPGSISRIYLKILAALHAYYDKTEGTQPLEPLFRKDREDAIAQAHLHLEESAFNEAWEAGEKMSLDDAIDLGIKIVQEM